MNEENIVKNYVLSQYTMDKLDRIREALKEDISNVDPSWSIISKKKEEEETIEDDSLNDSNKDCNNDVMDESDQFTSTQFYFTQTEKHFSKCIKQEDVRVSNSDITECLLEGLECSNGKLDLNQLENLTEVEVVEIVCGLEKRLSIQGTYNLCCSLNNIALGQRIKYASTFYSHLLLPKIIGLEEPSRLLSSILAESAQKCPEDIQNFIFVPLINVDLKDTTVVDAIINALEPQRHTILIREYLSNVKELKLWHLPILHTLITAKTDISTNDKLVQLLSGKAIEYAKDKNFAKIVLSFVKKNNEFSNEKKHMLWEISNVNETCFKKPIQNVLKNI
ncbi:uncharacterized protein LOC108622693 [Ceratina calcarata]|uniref:Uncharacterized protein LOC108622693 n=1 Tax=Ceratina calcarata TaxID=156304 RepID=A0AAJ7ITK7_9HYME|nr:uncharacterized protein LOC108622693 [Ceratina calcarata]XP_026667484.1 uncharacterized protein LOC108622693 [Ceratina calcarata]